MIMTWEICYTINQFHEKKVTLFGVYITQCARDCCETLLLILSQSGQIN